MAASIRIAPDELSFSEPAVIKEIYSQGTPFMKSPSNNGLYEGIPNLFNGISAAAEVSWQRLREEQYRRVRTTCGGADPEVHELGFEGRDSNEWVCMVPHAFARYHIFDSHG